MVVYVIALAAAVLVVPLTGGRFRELGRITLSRSWMLFLGLAIQVVLEVVEMPRARFDDVGLALLLASYALIIGFGLSNLSITGIGVITIGIALNAGVIALNAGMPYTPLAGERPETTVKHHAERPQDVLTILSDNITLGSFGSASFGDLILAVGLVDLCYRNSRRPRRTRARTRHPSEEPDIDLTAYERLADRGNGPAHDPFEGVEHPRVVDVSRT